jgi:hypothetical protein
MAKAILGHVGGPDPRLLAEVARLRRRVTDLQDEVLRLTEENQALLSGSLVDSLSDSLGDALADEIITLEPAGASQPTASAPALA